MSDDPRGAASWDAKRAQELFTDEQLWRVQRQTMSNIEAVQVRDGIRVLLAECGRLREREQAAYAEGYDQAHDDVWDAPVCSVCGENHDADESAMCEGGEVVSFREWVEACGRLREQLDAARQALEAAVAVAAEVRRATYWEIGTGGGKVVAVQVPIAEWDAARAALGVEGEPRGDTSDR